MSTEKHSGPVDTTKPVPEIVISIPNYAAVPDELKSLPQWVGWQYVDRKGKKTKMPFDAGLLSAAFFPSPAKSDKPSSWTSFEQTCALQQVMGGMGKLVGIGFVFAKRGGLVGIDLDNCIDPITREMKPWATEIIAQFSTYAEVSPSGTGVKLFCRGSLPTEKTGTRRPYHDGAVELYQHGRFFTVTGEKLPSAPSAIIECSDQLTELWARIAPAKQNKSAHHTSVAPVTDGQAPSREGPPPSDYGLLMKVRSSKKADVFERLWEGDITGYCSQSEADLALCNILAFYTGPDASRLDALFRKSGLMRDKWERDDYRSGTLGKAIDGCREFYDWAFASKKRQIPVTFDTSGPREIVIRTDEHRVNREAVAAIAQDPGLYCRAGLLIDVIDIDDVPKVRELPLPILRDRLTAMALFVEIKGEGQKKKTTPAHPPEWCVKAVGARGNWPGIRQLNGLVRLPTLRADGSILSCPGYDKQTGLLYVPGDCVPVVLDSPTRDDALRALELLFDVVCDFPFKSNAHRASWIAYLLSPLARHAFTGPVPLFLLDANVRGSGKSLLADIVSLIVTGNEAQRFANPESDDECRKRITAVMLADIPLLLIDNIAGSLGCASLDAALTATIWSDRELGRNRCVEGPLRTIWAASGNNVILEADTTRRVSHIRLESPEENPELRAGFRHPDIKRFVLGHRRELLEAALTVLRAWYVAGQPRIELPPWGSFEGWSDCVRQIIAWLGLPDPGSTRQELRDQSDREASALLDLLDGLDEADGDRTGLQSAEIVAKLDKSPERFAKLRNALLELCTAPGGKLNPRTVGNKLKHLRGRVAGGRCIDDRIMRGNRKAWIVRTVGIGSSGQLGGYSDQSGCSAPADLSREASSLNDCDSGPIDDRDQTNQSDHSNHDSIANRTETDVAE